MANTSQASATHKYFGNIRYNHVSPHVDIKGVNPLTKAESSTRPHYIFTYAGSGKLSEIIDKSYNVQKRHHLTNFGAYKVTFNYKDNQEIRVRQKTSRRLCLLTGYIHSTPLFMKRILSLM